MTTVGIMAAQAALAIGNSGELTLIAKVTVLLAAGLLAARALRPAAASVRHVVLACTFAALLALPLASAVAPPRLLLGIPNESETATSRQALAAPLVTLTATGSAIQNPDAAVETAETQMLASLGAVLRALWAAGAIAVLASFGVGLWSLGRLRRHAVPALRLMPLAGTIAREVGVRRSIALVTHERIAAPLTFGIRRATVMVPADIESWSDGEIRRALVHEIEHVRRFDWLLLLTARLACAVFWFNPLVWVAERRLRLEAERACDDVVIRDGDTTDYAEQLVSLARRFGEGRTVVTLGMATRSDLAVRVTALLDARQRRGRIAPSVAAPVAAVMTLVLGTVAAVQIVDASGDDETPLIEVGTSQQSRARGERSLYRASERGDVERMIELIDNGANVNRAFDGDGTPLIGAARQGRLNAVKLLLDRGADPNLAVEGDGNPLIMAAREGHRDVVALLLERGAHVNQVVPEDENALIQASAEGHGDVVKLLLSRGADVNIRAWAEAALERPDGEWRTALGMARRGRHDAVVKLLLAAGAREQR
jgi:beta-lactamase regulating signal transducer with metallopeptidase domain